MIQISGDCQTIIFMIFFTLIYLVIPVIRGQSNMILQCLPFQFTILILGDHENGIYGISKIWFLQIYNFNFNLTILMWGKVKI